MFKRIYRSATRSIKTNIEIIGHNLRYNSKQGKITTKSVHPPPPREKKVHQNLIYDIIMFKALASQRLGFVFGSFFSGTNLINAD